MITIMSTNFIEQMLTKAVRWRPIAQGSFLFHRNDLVRYIFAVEKGIIELVRTQSNGSQIVLQRAHHHTVLAEASLNSQTYHCDAVAVAPSVVFALPKPDFLKHLRNDNSFSELWSSHLAGQIQAARYRCEILTMKTVADRLDAWLDWHSNNLPPKGEWKSIAVQIGVSPEALYRELAKRRSQ